MNSPLSLYFEFLLLINVMVERGDFEESLFGCSFLDSFIVQWHFWHIRLVSGDEVNSCFDFFFTRFLFQITVLTTRVDFPL